MGTKDVVEKCEIRMEVIEIQGKWKNPGRHFLF